jgi:carboxymethylenebutenolidase
MAWINIPGSAVPLRCWLEQPTAARSLVLVLPEVFGINSWLRSIALRLAKEGHGALVLPLFARSSPDLELGYDQNALAQGRLHRDQVTVENFLADAQAVLAWRLEQPALRQLPVAAVGFCFGGHLAWHLASLAELAATASFYGARVASYRPGGGPPTLELANQIPGRFLAFMGEQDPLMPPEERQAIERALAQSDPSGRRLACISAAAGHGYMCDQRPDFQAEAAAAGWRQLLELLKSIEPLDLAGH